MALDERFLASCVEIEDDAARARREGDVILAEFLESLAEGVRRGVADFRAQDNRENAA